MRISKRMKAALLGSLAAGLAAHLFALTNVLQNYDNISQTPAGVGTGVTSGRWVLELLIRLHAEYHLNYNLPMINGMLTMLLLTLSACLIVKLADLKSPVLCAAFSALFISFPTVTSTLFFMYTAHYNTFAVFLAISAVWFARRYRYGFLVSAVLCAVSLGIYQAYLPMTASLFVILLVKELLLEKSDWKRVIVRAFFDLVTLILGLLLYFLCLHLTLQYCGASLSDYQGVNNMGHISLQSLPGILKNAWMEIARMPVADYYGVSSTALCRISVAVLAVLSVLLIVFLLVRKKGKCITITAIVCSVLCVLFPLAANGIAVMCPESEIYTLMVYASVFIFLMPAVLADMAGQEPCRSGGVPGRTGFPGRIRHLTAAVLILLCVQYIWLSNGNYMAAYYNTEQTKSYLGSMLTQARMTEGYQKSLPWAFIGNVSDETFHNPWQDIPRFTYGGNGVTGPKPLVNYYSRKSWFKNYMGYDITLVDKKIIRKLKKNSLVKEMPCYPDYGSIVIYKGMVVVKLSE